MVAPLFREDLLLFLLVVSFSVLFTASQKIPFSVIRKRLLRQSKAWVHRVTSEKPDSTWLRISPIELLECFLNTKEVELSAVHRKQRGGCGSECRIRRFIKRSPHDRKC